MSPLEAHLRADIAAHGPLSIARYMQICLLHPEWGYYSTRDPLGVSGDFTTAPEISQMFGEMLGLALAQSWLDRGSPAPFCLAELGPGRGTLMADMLRATARVPGFHDGARIHLVEASATLRAVQQTTLSHCDVTWHDSQADLPDLPLFLVANEFFDALPVRQFLRDGDGWRERVIGLQDNRLAFGLTDTAPQGTLEHRLADTATGDLVELCTPAQALAQDIGTRISAQGGVAMIVDYGSWGEPGDTFQALRAHRKVDPLDTPGSADLTAHVDFAALAAAAPCAHSGLTPQGVFLERLGITARAQTIARGLGEDRLQSHIAAHRRLTHPDEMGNLFRTLALFAHGTPLPPGLDP